MVKKYVLEILSQATNRELGSIALNAHLESDLGLDSISLASLIAKFEGIIHNKPNVESCLKSLLSAETVGELIEILDN